MAPTIPLIYQLFFLYFEPAAALLGTYMNLFDPSEFLRTMSPVAAGAPDKVVDAAVTLTRPIFDQVSALLLLFSWCEAVVLRNTNEARTWKTVLAGMALCDILHLWAAWRVLGPQVFLDPTRWRYQEWVNFVMLYVPLGLRLAVVAGVGIDEDPETKAKAGKKD